MSETKNTKSQIRLPILLALSISAGIWIGATFAEPKGNQNDLRAALYKLQEIMTYINRDYVDSVDTNELVEYGINKMLEKLDPHSSYIPAKDASLAQSQLEGEFDGIGVEFGIIRDTIYVVAPLTGGPSEALGIQSGDQIISVDGKNVAGIGITNRDVFDYLRGPRGSKVLVDIKRKNASDLITYEITRDKIPQYSINASYMINEEIGYIKVTRFAATTYEEFKKAVSDLQIKGMKKLIIDLQGNPGGYMGAAINMADELLGDRDLIVSQEGKVSQYSQKAFAFKPGMFEEGSVIILINEGSASASEILAGAVQDNDRGLIVGRRSFGKGLVQRPLDLSYGTQVKVTISRYYTPSGRCIQALDYSKKDAEGKAIKTDAKNFNAFKTRKGRTVYDGGGIQPDVELTETKLSAIAEALQKNDAIFNYATAYFYKNPNPGNTIPTISDTDFADFKAFLKKENFSFDTETEKQLKKTLEAAQNEKIDENIKAEYQNLMTALRKSEDIQLDKNKNEIKELLLDELIKRYQYKEGLYQYYIQNNSEVKKGTSILANASEYNKILLK